MATPSSAAEGSLATGGAFDATGGAFDVTELSNSINSVSGTGQIGSFETDPARPNTGCGTLQEGLTSEMIDAVTAYLTKAAASVEDPVAMTMSLKGFYASWQDAKPDKAAPLTKFERTVSSILNQDPDAQVAQLLPPSKVRSESDLALGDDFIALDDGETSQAQARSFRRDLRGLYTYDGLTGQQAAEARLKDHPLTSKAATTDKQRDNLQASKERHRHDRKELSDAICAAADEYSKLPELQRDAMAAPGYEGAGVVSPDDDVKLRDSLIDHLSESFGLWRISPMKGLHKKLLKDLWEHKFSYHSKRHPDNDGGSLTGTYRAIIEKKGLDIDEDLKSMQKVLAQAFGEAFGGSANEEGFLESLGLREESVKRLLASESEKWRDEGTYIEYKDMDKSGTLVLLRADGAAEPTEIQGAGSSSAPPPAAGGKEQEETNKTKTGRRRRPKPRVK